MMIALRLDATNPLRILATPADAVMTMWHYANFISEYEDTLGEINKP